MQHFTTFAVTGNVILRARVPIRDASLAGFLTDEPDAPHREYT